MDQYSTDRSYYFPPTFSMLRSVINTMADSVRDIYVEEIMTKVPVIGSTNLSAKDIAVLMTSWKVGSVILVENDQPVGIVTERDIVEKLVSQDIRPSDVCASMIMTEPLVTIGPRDSVADAARKMARLGLRRLPVVDKEQLVGMLTENDSTSHISFPDRYHT